MNSVPFYAVAEINGNNDYPDIMGTVVFKKKSNGVLITTEIFNLPYEIGKCRKEREKPGRTVHSRKQRGIRKSL